jgi:3-methyl-2-oxobutanoate hydroxymethyltransferase
MLIFTKAVAKGTKKALVVADMPFMSYHSDIKTAVENAGKFIKTGAKAVKIEGGSNYIVEVVKHCVGVGIPVMAHLGFTPQFLHTIGGYNIQGKDFEATMEILKQARDLQKAGAFALVLEMMPEESAQYITENIDIPTIGIGAGKFCSGQILVIDDLLGKYSDFTPKFAKKYANLSEIIKNATTEYIEDVKNSSFPTDEHCFHLEKCEKDRLYNANDNQN